ncbi:Small G protein signaling modulator 3 (RUN and TBC1 domain-containing protein 3) [Durusdinium trenchii]|uniref:Small G protein signaling modulator 3 (RUN and TBC1 domain-containing protein 3) n=1 Tax=Durusdinium trenchii TaxID=1381693 RepID=A0ABP0N6W6_9DINO
MTTPPPLRLVMKSYDKLSQISMKVTWIDEDGEEQNWSSWDDALCGRCGATKVLPAQSRDIQVRFRVQPGGRKVQQVDRKNRCAWTRAGEEVIHLRSYGDDSKGIDAWFELRGPMTHCHVWRAWNACNTGAPDPWEHWPDFPSDRAAPPPATLQAADTAAPWPGNQASPKGEDYTVRVTGAMSRLVAAAEVLLAVRRRTSRALEELDNQLTKQWFRVNSGNTVAAGLAVASFGSLFVAPPIGVALGATSAAAGVSSGAGDVVADAEKGRNLAKLMEVDITEELAFDSIESELRCALAKAVQRQRGASRGGAAATTALAAYAQTANLVLLRSAKYIALSQAGAESLALAGRLLGGLGAGLAVGVAAHGWSTTKPMQKLVKEKLIEIERSMEYLEGLRQQMSGALRCPLCDEPLGFGARELRRCSRFHCFHAHCVQEGCPECEEPVARVKSTDQLGALLWLAGIRDFCALTLDSLAPQLNHARDLVQRLTTSEDVGLIMQRRVDDEDAENDSPKSSGSPKRSDEAPEEVAEAHEAWQLAMEETHLLDGTCLAKVAVEKLLLGYGGMPLKYRHRLWPHLLGSISGRALEELLLVPLPPKVSEQINADVPRTRHSLVAGRHAALRRVLHAVGAARPEVGYAQGMNQLAAVFLKLGFEEEKAVHMMDAIMKDLLPGCHHPDLHGLFRDTGVADILIQSFLPRHAMAFETAGIQVIWFTVDYFLTLGSNATSLPFIAGLWDLCFLWGPRALFSGFLAMLDLYFEIPRTEEELEDSELLMKKFKAALAEASPDGFAAQTAEFLHERQGGISDELISTLRDQVTST